MRCFSVSGLIKFYPSLVDQMISQKRGYASTREHKNYVRCTNCTIKSNYPNQVMYIFIFFGGEKIFLLTFIIKKKNKIKYTLLPFNELFLNKHHVVN